MIAGVADTHTALWYLFGDSRLSVRAKAFIDQAAALRHSIEISPISLAEIVYLVEKSRIPASALDDLRSALDNPDQAFKEAPFTKDIVSAMRRVPRDEVPDMPDRIVAATAVYFGVPVISKDARIRASAMQTRLVAGPSSSSAPTLRGLGGNRGIEPRTQFLKRRCRTSPSQLVNRIEQRYVSPESRQRSK